jgi:putative transposase
MGLPASTFYYWKKPKEEPKKHFKNKPFYTYNEIDRQEILDVMNSDRYLDKTPYEIYASQLDEGNYLCSKRTMYRILHENMQVKERRKQRRTNHYQKPELLATSPNQLWTWDITKLKSSEKWTYFYLYVIIDVYSRYIVGWMLAYREEAALAKKLIQETCEKHQIKKGQLTIHADRGSSMTSKPVALLLNDIGVIKSHSRPYVSNDNPFSESHFKTLKYRPDFPPFFNNMVEAKDFCQHFFSWYNQEHYHSGIAFLTPESVHYDFAGVILENRYQVLTAAYDKNPARFKGNKPKRFSIEKEVYINPSFDKFSVSYGIASIGVSFGHYK